MAMKFTNNATTTLASSITSSATSLTVSASSGSLFPTLGGSDYFYCTLASSSGAIEIIKVTARSTDTFTIVRAQDNTTASAWNSGDKVELRLVAASLNDLPKLDEANTFTGANNYGTPASITLTNGTGLPLTTGVTGILPAANGGTGTSTGYYGFKNRIINGAMDISQRGTTAFTPTDGAYTLDRWVAGLTQASKFTIQQTPSATETGFAVRVAAGFSNYLACTVAAAANVTIGASDVFAIQQKIEGFNFADMAWGTSAAKTVTLSFLAYSSVTGTFGGAMVNSANNRSYPFTYSIPTANTWTTISVTIAGDTTGTWVGATNGIGAKIWFSLGAGSSGLNTAGAWVGANSYSATGAVSPITTNSATFYITGVQLEKGSTATSFDYRPYGTELQLCQRYYEKSGQYFVRGDVNSVSHYTPFFFKTTKRTTPTSVTLTLSYGGTGSGGAAVNSMADGFEFLYSVGATASSSYASVVYAADSEL